MGLMRRLAWRFSCLWSGSPSKWSIWRAGGSPGGQSRGSKSKHSKVSPPYWMRNSMRRKGRHSHRKFRLVALANQNQGPES